MPDLIPKLNAQRSNPMLFGIGFLTGFHCIGMCGSFVVSYSNQSVRSLRPKTIVITGLLGIFTLAGFRL